MARSRGRPTAYIEEYAELAKKLCKLGATDAELADFFKVDVTTIWRWQSRHPEFCNALRGGKDEADDRVERSLYQRAVGYTYDATKIINDKGHVTLVPYREHVAPDTTACIFWLKNRRKEQWREKIDHTHSGPNGGPIQNELVISAADDAKKRLAALIGKESEV